MIQIDPNYTICQRSSLTRLHLRVQTMNEQSPKTRYTRLINGQPVQLERQTRVITGNVEATMERLIKDYVREYHRLLKTVGPSALADGMPPLRLSRPSLANRRTICEKTVYDHLSRLRKAGFITQYRFRGTRHAFEIWIDPELLFQPERLDVAAVVDKAVDNPQLAEKQTTPPASLDEPTANFTAYKATVTQRTEETEKKEAVACGQGNAPKLEQGNNQGNTEQPAPKTGSAQVTMWQNRTSGPIEKPSTGGAGARLKARLTKKDLEVQAETNRTPDERQAILLGYVQSFWSYAEGRLYAGRSFATSETRLILRSIWAGVYNCFNMRMTEREWDTYQADLYRRVDLAAGYYSRHTEKWVPAPYAEFKAGSGYFDWDNERGFRQTELWLSQNRQKLAKSRTQQTVNLAIRHLRQFRTNPDKAPKYLRGKTLIEAYRLLEARMLAVSPTAADRFRELAATLDGSGPTLTTGFTKNFRK